MREILFRGKRSGIIDHENDGEWAEGCYFEINGQSLIMTDDHRALAVDPSTVGQYTGLTDKNGKKIFEGDIVKVEKNDHDWHEHDPNSYSIFAVDFDEGGYTAGDCFLQNWLWFDGFHGEVIGNIHDTHDIQSYRVLLEDKP